ncbi:MAG TPA: serine hydrolase [Gemmatimonadaceae bacterium]|nr:serine hydrolase [Gemmatimonadaceae bacterium]
MGISLIKAYGLAGALVLAAPATAPLAQSSRGTSPDWASFDKYVAQSARDWRVPGMAIAVVHGDSLVFARGYGVRKVGASDRADEHTRFAIGSTTKAMTAAGLAMLVDEGKLRLDDRVIDHIPEFQLHDPWVTREVTIRDLLLHRTGLPGTDGLWGRFSYSPEEMMRRLRYVKPNSSFRSRWDYQNVMYGVAGLVLERVSGMSWEAFLRTRIFAPLGMTETEPLVAGILSKPNVATPHGLRRDSVYITRLGNTDSIAPAGSVWSSVSDMSKWMRFILDSGRVGSRRLISEASFRELVTPQIQAPPSMYPALQLSRPHSFNYGLAWFIHDYRLQPVWMHTGSINGMSAIVGLLPASRAGVVVLLNLDHAELRHALMYKTFDQFLGGPARDWSAELRSLMAASGGGGPNVAANAPASAGPSLPLEKYTGVFVDSAYGKIQVTLANGVLRAQVENERPVDLEPAGYERFRSRTPSEGPGTVLTFVPDGAGNISAVRLSGTMLFSRVSTGGRR